MYLFNSLSFYSSSSISGSSIRVIDGSWYVGNARSPKAEFADKARRQFYVLSSQLYSAKAREVVCVAKLPAVGPFKVDHLLSDSELNALTLPAYDVVVDGTST